MRGIKCGGKYINSSLTAITHERAVKPFGILWRLRDVDHLLLWKPSD